MKIVQAIIAVSFGIIAGLAIPDFDQEVIRLLGHRSILTHGFILPLAVFLVVPMNEAFARLTTAGFCMGIAMHSAFDLFPREWVGTALIRIPNIAFLPPTVSMAWLAVSIAVCFVLALLLLHTQTERGIAAALLVVSFWFASAHERMVFLALIALVIGLVVALGVHITVGQRLLKFRPA